MHQDPSFFVRAPEKRRSSPARFTLALGLLFVSTAGLAPACGSSTRTRPDQEECEDGYIHPETGVCEGKCTPDKCVADNTCVGNRCLLKCSSHLDCYRDGTQNCAPAVEDDTSAPINACQPNGKTFAVGFGCPFGVECKAFGVCPSGQSCSLAQCGGMPDSCVKNTEVCGDDPSCTAGKCAADGTACSVNPCAAAECSSLICITKGEGDADAYCSKPSCATDDDCAGGYYCGLVRDPHELCGSDPPKGNNTLCGETDEPCIDASALGQGNSLEEGSRCILRKTCIKRGQCAPCANDLDCSLAASHTCVDVGGQKRCARACAVDKDCDPDYACSNGACTPRSGACVGMGGFCEPCLNDSDCGGKETSRICFEFSGGQKACIDTKAGQCTTDAECPKSPGNGLNGLCSSGACLPPLYQDELACW
jgi:hypothetical protein